MSTTSSVSGGTVDPSLLATMNAKPAGSGDQVTDATNKFLTMLVTQLKNQDPLNPLDNAQITSQLAQLSTVTGVNKLNDTLASLKDSYRMTENMQAAGMIHHGVLVEGGRTQLSQGQAILGVEVTSPADSVKLVLSDPRTGKDVQVLDLGAQQPGIVPLSWDGIPDRTNLDANGNPVRLPDGVYTARIVATRGGEEVKDAAKPLQLDRVDSVTTGAKDGVKLNLANKGEMTMADIKQIL